MEIIILGFTEKVLRILELDDLKNIVLIDEVILKSEISDDSYFKKNLAEITNDFSEKLSKIFKSETIAPKTASIVLDTSQAFLNVFPVDFGENPNSINSHILWELSNYFPDTYKDFNIKYYRLGNKFSNDNIAEILLIALNKNKMELIKKLCNGCNIKIKNVELDQFAVEKCLKENYPAEIKDKNVLIIGCRNSRFDFSLIANGVLKYYDYQIIDGINFQNALMRQLNFFGSELSNYKISKLFLYGEDIALAVTNFIEEEFKSFEISLINPGKNNLVGEVNLSKFAPLYGLALKNFM